MLHGDQTRCEENINMVYRASTPAMATFFSTLMLMRHLFAVDNLVYATFTANTYCVESEETHVAM